MLCDLPIVEGSAKGDEHASVEDFKITREHVFPQPSSPEGPTLVRATSLNCFTAAGDECELEEGEETHQRHSQVSKLPHRNKMAAAATLSEAKIEPKLPHR
jgi:hypothetical protein